MKAKLAGQTIIVSTPITELDRVEEWLSKAIELDGKFAAAFVERANIRIYKLGYSHDVGDRLLEATRVRSKTPALR